MDRFKGQSAIEYLTTYGWMLLVIAIVGGAIFNTVQDRSNVRSVSGLNDDVRVDDFAVSDEGGLQAEVSAATGDPVEISNVSVRDPETNEKVSNCDNSVVAVGETEAVNISGVEYSETSNKYDVIINYDTGSLKNLEANGSITGNFNLNSSQGCSEGSGNSGDSGNSVPDAMTSSDFQVTK